MLVKPYKEGTTFAFKGTAKEIETPNGRRLWAWHGDQLWRPCEKPELPA